MLRPLQLVAATAGIQGKDEKGEEGLLSWTSIGLIFICFIQSPGESFTFVAGEMAQ